MEIEMKQRLIGLVRENECLYNNKHKDYKNNILKTQLWENIAAALSMDVNEAKQTWRTLRDGYTRHLNQVKWHKVSSRRYTHYTWSADLTFLDDFIDRLPASRSFDDSKSKAKFKLTPSATSRIHEPGSLKLEKRPILPKSVLTRDSDSNENSRLSPINTKQSSQFFQEIPLQPESPNVGLIPTVPLPNSERNSQNFKRRNSDSSDENFTKKRKDDAVDHLFRSYAETFRRFSKRKQAELKVVLAEMFAEAELSELENDTHVSKDFKPMAYCSVGESSETGIKKEIFWYSSE